MKFWSRSASGLKHIPDGVTGLAGGVGDVLRGPWGPGEVASSGLLPGFEVRVDEVTGGK